MRRLVLRLAPTPMIERSRPLPYKEILTGFAFLLGLAAFVMSLRNMRQLKELKRVQEATARRTERESEQLEARAKVEIEP